MSDSLDSSPLINSLREEVLWLLIGFHAYIRKRQTWTVPEDTRLDLHDDLIFFDAMSRDLIIRLYRLDDDQSGTVSLRQVNKTVRKVINDQRRLTEIDGAITDYRSSINRLKTQHRNLYVAHLRVGEAAAYRTPDLPEDVVAGIRKAVETLDIISGRTVQYSRRIGSQEGSVDLRTELGFHDL